MSLVVKDSPDASSAPNPANKAARPEQATKEARKRIPMTLPKAKLAVPEIPGYHLHWMADRPGRILQAIQAGYEFVDKNELGMQDFGLGSDASRLAPAEHASHIAVVGGAGEAGQTELLFLMKIKQELWEEDQQGLQDRNDSVMEAITKRGLDAAGADNSQRYVKTAKIERKSIG